MKLWELLFSTLDREELSTKVIVQQGNSQPFHSRCITNAPPIPPKKP